MCFHYIHIMGEETLASGKNMCTTLQCTSARSVELSRDMPRDTITTRRPKHHQQQNIYRHLHLSCLQGGEHGLTSAGCCDKASLEDRKGLQALTALIGSVNEAARDPSDGHHGRHPPCMNKNGEI